MRNLKHEEELNRAHVKELADTRAKLEEYSDAVDVGEREKVVAEKERAIGDIEGPSTTAPTPPTVPFASAAGSSRFPKYLLKCAEYRSLARSIFGC